MPIKAEDFPEYNAANLSAGVNADKIEAHAADIDFFNAQLKINDRSHANLNTTATPNFFSEQADQLKTLRSSVTKKLNSFSRGTNPKALRTYARSLSESQLHTIYVVKVLNKGVQCVEKLSTMQ